MLRLIAVGVVVTCSLLIAAPVPKPTERELKARWGEIVKGAEEDFGEHKSGRLVLGAGAHVKKFGNIPDKHLFADAIRTRQTVRGDFAAAVRVEAIELTDEDWLSGRAGLYACDTENVVAISWNSPMRKPTGRPIELCWTMPGRLSTSRPLILMTCDDPIWLHVARVGESIFVSACRDGKPAWDLSTHLTLADEVEVGVYTHQAKGVAIQATFSEFKLTAGKK